MRLLALVAAVAALSVPARSENPSLSRAVGEVVAAFRAGDRDALARLAARDDPDPWIVADRLCSADEHDAADAFAGAAPRIDVQRLAEYVARRRKVAILAGADGGDAVTGVELLYTRGRLDQSGKRWKQAVAAYREAAESAGRIGWLARQADALHHAGACASSASDFRAALAAWERARVVYESRGNRGSVAATLVNIGAMQRRLGALARALQSYERAVAIAEGLEDRTRLAHALGGFGSTHWSLGDYARARRLQERALLLFEKLEDAQGVARMLGNLGATHDRQGDYPRALEFHERALRAQEDLPDRSGIASSLSNLGSIHDRLGNYDEALRYQERALETYRELGDRAGVARTVGAIGEVHASLGEHAESLAHYERCLELSRGLGIRSDIAASLVNAGVAHKKLGDYTRAMECLEEGRREAAAIGHRQWAANAIANMTSIHMRLGDCARALSTAERALRLLEALGDRPGVARALAVIGSVHGRLGDHARQLDFFDRSMELWSELGHRPGVAAALLRMGRVHLALGDQATALDYLERSLHIHEALEDRSGVAATLLEIGLARLLRREARSRVYLEKGLQLGEDIGSRQLIARALGHIGLYHSSQGDESKALAYLERSLKLRDPVRDRVGVARMLAQIGGTHLHAGDLAAAREYSERALALARETDDRTAIVATLWALSLVHLGRDEPAHAVRIAREGIEGLPRLVGRLPEVFGAMARGRFAGLFEVGVVAATRISDPAAVSFFLESGRCAALLESLGGRDAMDAVAVPHALSRKEIEARSAVVKARARLGRAHVGGRLDEIGAARESLRRAQDEALAVVIRVQRTARLTADVRYGAAAPLGTIRGALREGEALVVYALLRGTGTRAAPRHDPLALVVTRETARVVRLGSADEVDDALSAGLSVGNGRADSTAGLAAARRTLIAPLGLGSGQRRLLVSPSGDLAHVPFAVLAREHEVVFVPSGTTYALLRDEAGKRGDAVLALGDPDYRTARHGHSETILRRDTGLQGLPGTRAEANAIGEIVLLGRDATESGLRDALAERPRWRAVHLACHGLVDPERPQLSSLALSPGGGDDGFLTALDVLRMDIAADLVVLSACETGKGKVYRAEGVIGFTRAFMYAGAPRVIVSLWKVDDEATRELMVEFYALWNPKDGSKGLPTATALKRAQEHVASHEKWKHPYYWAAWQLWGVGD